MRLIAWCALCFGVMLSQVTMAAAGAQPWLDSKRSPDERARLALAEMTLPEKISLLHGYMAIHFAPPGMPMPVVPEEAIPAAGYIPGIPRLGIPALYESDASLGITNPLAARAGDVATALPSGLALASTFDPVLAYRAGVVLGSEARAKGFNVLLGGGMDLTRDPRNGRNFEYLGEDPLLAGLLAGAEVRGTQGQHVISTVKHYALNAHETNRLTLDARIDPAALRESDLLAFQIAIEQGNPGSVMCAYNAVNGAYACGNGWLLNDVLKRDWQYKGWVMSDWAAVHSTDYALQGLDQQSGSQLDKQVWFGAPLQAAVESGAVPVARIDDMARRILRTMFSVGIVEFPPAKEPIDFKAHAAEALEVARSGAVLLKNEGPLLPLSTGLKRIAVIGGQAHIGVLSGGGSSQVMPSNGAPVTVPVGGRGLMMEFRNEFFFPSSPLKFIQAASPGTQVIYDAGNFPEDAATLAASVDVAVVFATRHELEGYDIPNLRLPNGQDLLVDAVSAANPHTVVVLETGNPVTMPWLSHVAAVLAAWYPGQEGGQAIADILFGSVNPSGHLPITFPIDEAHTVRPKLPNFGSEPETNVTVDYTEGADVGYRWFLRQGVKALFPFGHGLSYSTFQYDTFKAKAGKTLNVSFTVRNASGPRGADVPQVYLMSVDGKSEPRLLGFKRVSLEPGAVQTVALEVDRRLLAHFDEPSDRWQIKPGHYRLALGHSAEDLVLTRDVIMPGAIFK